MAIVHVSTSALESRIAKARSIEVSRFAAACAVTAAIVFGLCWLGTLIPLASPTHAFIRLFTDAPRASLEALGDSAAWSFLSGGVAGATFAVSFNLFAGLHGR